MKKAYFIFIFLLKISQSYSGNTPDIAAQALVLVINGPQTEPNLHCIGYFISQHTILTTCSCVGRFIGDEYVPYDRKKLRFYNLNFDRFTIVLSMRTRKCEKLTNRSNFFKFDFGNWMTKEETPFWTGYDRTKHGDPENCKFFNPKLKGDSSKIYFQIDKLSLALSSDCASLLYDSRRTNTTTRGQIRIISHLLHVGGSECYKYNNSSFSDGIRVRGSPVFCGTYLSGIAILGGNGHVLVHTIAKDFSKYFETVDMVEKSLSDLPIANFALVGKVTIILLISYLSFLFV